MPRANAHDTARQKKAFLAAFEVNGNITAACEIAGIGRRTVYDWQEKDERFVQDMNLADVAATEKLELEAHRRAHDGVIKETPIIHNGKVVYTVTEHRYSDTLLIFLLKARAPDKYRENLNISGKVDHAVTVEAVRKALELVA